MTSEERQQVNSLIRSGLLLLPPESLVDMIMEGLEDLNETEIQEFLESVNSDSESGELPVIDT